MAIITSILCPVDLSDSGRGPLDYALFLARGTGARVEVLHVWDLPVVVSPDLIIWTESASGATLADLVKMRAEAAMRHFLAPLPEADRALLAVHLEPGSPAIAIVERAASAGHDLVVMGTHGRSGVSRLFLGSVAERVVRHAPCPVLTVHNWSDSTRSTSM